MRTKRLKVTADNYEGLHKVVNSLPKGTKNNTSIREAMNISIGTWHYLRASKSYEDFKEQVCHRVKQELPEAPQEREGMPAETFTTAPPIVELIGALRGIERNLARLCVAWEAGPHKKSWLK